MGWIALLCFAGLAFGQGSQPKPKPEDYEVTVQGKNFRIGADYMVHSFSGGRQTFIIENYLVVEVGLYPPKGESVKVDPSAFRLRIDGRKPILAPDQPAVAAAAMQRQGSALSKVLGSAAQMGGVILGGGRPAGAGSPPQRPPAPDPPGGVSREDPESAVELLQAVALPAGEYPGAVSGFLYFPYKGKPGKIESLELLYQDTLLRLR